MIFVLKLLMGGLAGGALIATPILVTQLPKSARVFQYKDSNGKKIECLGDRAFGLEVDGETVLWAGLRESVENTNKHQYQNRGTIFTGDKSSCELEVPTNNSAN